MPELCGFLTCPDERVGQMTIEASVVDSGKGLAKLVIPMCDEHHLMVEAMAVALPGAPEKLLSAIDSLANQDRCQLIEEEDSDA